MESEASPRVTNGFSEDTQKSLVKRLGQDRPEVDIKFSEGFESKSTEGGRGSGRKGHQKWMLGGEADPIECPNCMVYTEKKDGNCQICGNSY